MENNCLHCNHLIDENFCPHCGQRKYKRIDRKYILGEIQNTVLQVNKGFLYSIKKVIVNPGKTAREFIDGDRVKHYKPILLLFVISGISTFISYKIADMDEVLRSGLSEDVINTQIMTKYLMIMRRYSSLIMLAFAPMFALTTKIAFRKWGHNYYEHVVMNAYILVFYTLITMVLAYPFMYLFNDSPAIIYNISVLQMLIVPIILVWFFKGFYRERPLKSIILRVLGTLGLVILGYILLIIIIAIIVIILSTINGLEVLEYFPQPQQ